MEVLLMGRVGCEPKIESRFFPVGFCRFSRPKIDFLKPVFRLPRKPKPKNRVGLSVGFVLQPCLLTPQH